MYKASEALESAILRLAPPYTLHDPICQNWRELKAWHRDTGYQYINRYWAPRWPIAVHQAGTGPEHNIFSSRHVHFAFRAWHDRLHCILDADFSNAGEYRVSCEHIRQLRAAGVPAHDRRAIWAFVAGEVAHWNRWKAFIDYKREFVTFALGRGLAKALEFRWDYACI